MKQTQGEAVEAPQRCEDPFCEECPQCLAAKAAEERAKVEEAKLPLAQRALACYHRINERNRLAEERRAAQQKARDDARCTEVLRASMEKLGLDVEVTGPEVILDGITLRGTSLMGTLLLVLRCAECGEEAKREVSDLYQTGAFLQAWRANHRCPTPEEPKAAPAPAPKPIYDPKTPEGFLRYVLENGEHPENICSVHAAGYLAIVEALRGDA
jgi:hypothetical protein